MLGQEDRTPDRGPSMKQLLMIRCCTKGPVDCGNL